MKTAHVEITVRFDDGEVPDYTGPYAAKAIRPYEMRMVFSPPSQYFPDGQSFGRVKGWQVKKDGTAGSVSAEKWTPQSRNDWPAWMTAAFDRYQPKWD